MSVNISSTPYSLNASRRPIYFNVTSDRYTNFAFTGITVDNNGGFCRFTLGSSHGILAGDVLTPTLFSDSINVRQTVTGVTGTTVTTDLAWPTPADTSGTVTRTNDNFRIKCEITVSSVIVGTLYKQYKSTGFQFDISGIIDSLLTYDLPVFTGGAIYTTKSNSILSFTCTFTEVYDTAAGVSQLKDTATSSAYKAIKASREHIEEQRLPNAGFDADGPTKLFLTNAPRGEKTPLYVGFGYHLSFWTSLSETFTPYYAVDGGTPVAGSAGVIVNGYGQIYIQPSYFTSANSYLEAWIVGDKTGQITEKFKFDIQNICVPEDYLWLHWRNRLGAWDSFLFPYSYAVDQETEMAEIKKPLPLSGFSTHTRGKENYYANPTQYIEAESRYLYKDVAKWLFELQSSKQIFKRVGSNMIALINPEIEIKAESSNDGLIKLGIRLENPQIE